MANKTDKINTLRNILVIATTVLMILVVVFQWLEIDKFGIQDHMTKTLKGLFVSEAPPAEAAPATVPGNAPAADNAAEPAPPAP